MTAFLPPNLLALFAPREPLLYLPPIDVLPTEKKPWPYTGVAQYLGEFEDPKDTPAPTKAETKLERKTRKRNEREERYQIKLERALEEWDPHGNSNATSDAFKTLFIGRVNYDTSESKLKREFEQFGRIRKISLVYDQKTGKPRGYGFIEYERERDMKAAYKYGDGKKIEGRRVVVDVERGRTNKSWKPRRLGGGLGGTRKGRPEECLKYSGRVDERESNDRDRRRERDDNRDRDKDRSRDDREKNRDRDRDRDRERRRGRSRSRDRDRRDHRDRSKERRDRSRSRDRDRKKDRSRSRDRDKKKDHKRDKHHKDKSRDKDRDKEERRRDHKDTNEVHVKQEEDEGRYGGGDEHSEPPVKQERREYDNVNENGQRVEPMESY